VGCHNEHNLCSSCELPFSRIEGHVQHQQLGGRLPVPCSVCQSEFDRVQTEDFACRIWEQLKNAHAGNTQVQTQLLATYGREYDNFTHLHGESIDAMFQRFMVIVNHMRANVVVLSYDDHDRAIKLLHSLYRTVWSEKVEAFLSRRSMRPS
jgi:tRNA U54 and U55 pseudouridine synthase Pus10